MIRNYWKLYYAAKKRAEAGKGRKYVLLAEKYYKLAQDQSELRIQSSTMMGRRLGVIKDEYNNPGELYEGWYRLKDLRKGEFVKKTPGSKKVYRKGEYDRTYKAFRLNDQDDINRDVLVKGNAEVWVGFTY